MKPYFPNNLLLNSLSLETTAKTALGEQRLVMLAADEVSSSLEFGKDGVTEPPPRALPVGAEDEGPTGRLGLVGNSGTHFSPRSTTMIVHSQELSPSKMVRTH